MFDSVNGSEITAVKECLIDNGFTSFAEREVRRTTAAGTGTELNHSRPEQVHTAQECQCLCDLDLGTDGNDGE